jgi:antitoxin HicB
MKRAKRKKMGGIGSSFDDFLKEEGIYEGVTARAIKRVLARQLGELMRREEISKTELATRMKTSRAQLDRLLDPDNESVTLGTLARAAQAVGRHLRMELDETPQRCGSESQRRRFPRSFGNAPSCGPDFPAIISQL